MFKVLQKGLNNSSDELLMHLYLLHISFITFLILDRLGHRSGIPNLVVTTHAVTPKAASIHGKSFTDGDSGTPGQIRPVMEQFS
jgi:hypothetical protein